MNTKAIANFEFKGMVGCLKSTTKIFMTERIPKKGITNKVFLPNKS
jgi:hypothetical protein